MITGVACSGFFFLELGVFVIAFKMIVHMKWGVA